MYLLQGNHLPTSASVGRARLQYRDSVPLARVFLELCDLDREAYWLFARFRQMMDGVDSGLLVRGALQWESFHCRTVPCSLQTIKYLALQILLLHTTV